MAVVPAVILLITVIGPQSALGTNLTLCFPLSAFSRNEVTGEPEGLLWGDDAAVEAAVLLAAVEDVNDADCRLLGDASCASLIASGDGKSPPQARTHGGIILGSISGSA